MHRFGSGCVLLVAVALTAAACSSGPKPAAASSPTGTPSPAPVPSPATPTPTATTSPTATPATGTVTARLLGPTLPAPRYRTMGAAMGGTLFLLGGLDAAGVSSADVERIAPDTGQAALAGHLATPTHGAAAVAFGNQILVFGGAKVSPDDLVQTFDPATGATAVTGHMPSPRADLVAAVVGGHVILLGGFNGSSFVSDVWATSDGRSFSVVGRVAQVERYPAIAVAGTTVYLFGGLLAGGEYTGTYSRTIQSFDLATGRSAVIGQLPTPLGHARAAVVGGQVLVFGGWTPAGASAAILRFDPASGEVTPAGTMTEAVADEAIGAIGNGVLFAGGIGTGQRPLIGIGSLTVAASP